MKIQSLAFALLALSALMPTAHASPSQDKVQAMNDFMSCGDPKSDKCLDAYQRIQDAEKAEKEQAIRDASR